VKTSANATQTTMSMAS